MYIVIHCGGMPFNGETINTKSLGGSETAAYYLAKEMAAKGHHVTMFTNSQEEGTFDKVTYHWAGNVDQNTPFGSRFQFWVSNNPHDVLIVQRNPSAFSQKWASKMNILWLHDLALYRQKATAVGCSWNINQVWTVSDFHKKQIQDVYDYSERTVKVIRNGVDYKLYSDDVKRFPVVHGKDKISMVYSSRPERGLEHLVKKGGIMEKLLEEGDRFHLYVCGYDNTVPQMRSFYEGLWARCEELPNVTNVGALTKKHLSELQIEVDLSLYPTEFEEVSCITAMEACAAGTPFISSAYAALPETCSVMQSTLLPTLDGVADEEGFVEYLTNLSKEDIKDMSMKQRGLRDSKPHSWEASAEEALHNIERFFQDNVSNVGALARHFIYTSDIAALEKLEEGIGEEDVLGGTVLHNAMEEHGDCYKFFINDTFDEHYKAYYQYEKERGVNYGPEDLSHNPRFNTVASMVYGFDDGLCILDYGCAHGHYTINLARRFPGLNFIGVDIDASNIEKARKWAEDEGIPNVCFIHGRTEKETGEIISLSQEGDDHTFQHALSELGSDGGVHGIIAAEVLEHVADPKAVIEVLDNYLIDGGLLIVTTPFGGWEAMGYEEHWPWRAHLWHFERKDLADLFKGNDNFNITVVPSGQDKYEELCGSYVTVVEKDGHIKLGDLHSDDYKFTIQSPRQTISACLVVRDAEETILSCLKSLKGVVDEIIIGVDKNTIDGTRKIIKEWSDDLNLWPIVKVIEIETPLVDGFDTARNATIHKVTCDWILWIDADEKLIKGERIHKYLIENQFDSYCIAQHHIAAEPAGLLKTDLPSRLFRKRLGAVFFGRVHEHPEIEMNKGMGKAMVLQDISILHGGYTTESIRRGRFERNLPLLARDREDYPDRKLGKFLWVRDLAQSCMYESESNGGVVTDNMVKNAREGLELFEEILNEENIPARMLVDVLPYSNHCAAVLGNVFELVFKLSSSKLGGGINIDVEAPIHGVFSSKESARKLMNKLLEERLLNYESKYF